jgi:hypothetical protein
MSIGGPVRNPVELELVISADEMDTATFAKHMNARHADSLGGLASLDFRGKEHLAQMWRSFHNQLHRVRLDLNHEHAPFRAAPGSGPRRSGATPIR